MLINHKKTMLMLVNYHHELCGSPYGDIDNSPWNSPCFKNFRRLHGLVAEVHELPGITSGGQTVRRVKWIKYVVNSG